MKIAYAARKIFYADMVEQADTTGLSPVALGRVSSKLSISTKTVDVTRIIVGCEKLRGADK